MSRRQGDPIRESFERGVLDLVYYQDESDTTQSEITRKMDTKPAQQGSSLREFFQGLKCVPVSHSGNSEETEVINKQLSTFRAALNNIRDQMEFADVTLTCGQKTFKAHKVILCASSPYFRRMFSTELNEAKTGKVNLEGVDPDSLEVIVKVLYLHSFPKICNTERLKALMAASHMLQFSSVFDYCSDQYMKKLDHNNFLDIWNTAELYDNKNMLALIPVELAKRFDKVKTANDFLCLTVGQLLVLVNCLMDEDYSTDDTLKSIFDWIKYEQAARIQHLPQLFSTVDLTCISTDYLSALLQNEHILKNCIDVTSQIMAAAATRLSDLSLQSEEMQARFVVLGIKNTSQSLATNSHGFQQPFLLQYYDLSNKTWSSIVSLPSQYDEHNFTLVVVKDILYCITTTDPYDYDYGYRRGHGFPSGHNSTMSIIQLSLHSSRSPTVRQSQLEYRIAPGAAVLNDEIYIVGGTNRNGEKLRTVEKYNVTQKNITRPQQMIKPHNTQAVVSTSHHLFVADVENSRSIIEQYDPVINQWHLLQLDFGQPIANTIFPAGKVATSTGKLFFIHNSDLFRCDPKLNICTLIKAPKLSFASVWGMSNPKVECPFLMLLTTDNRLYKFRPSSKSFRKVPTSSAVTTLHYCALTAS